MSECALCRGHHRGGKSCVMGTLANNLDVSDELFPFGVDRRVVSKDWVERFQAGYCRSDLAWEESEPVGSEWASGDHPELVKDLRDQARHVSPPKECRNGIVRRLVQGVTGLSHTTE